MTRCASGFIPPPRIDDLCFTLNRCEAGVLGQIRNEPFGSAACQHVRHARATPTEEKGYESVSDPPNLRNSARLISSYFPYAVFRRNDIGNRRPSSRSAIPCDINQCFRFLLKTNRNSDCHAVSPRVQVKNPRFTLLISSIGSYVYVSRKGSGHGSNYWNCPRILGLYVQYFPGRFMQISIIRGEDLRYLLNVGAALV